MCLRDHSGAYLLILEVSVLGLNGVKLVSEGEEVLVSLLDLEDLSFELRDEEVLLVGGEVNTVVVLFTVSPLCLLLTSVGK